MVSFTSFVYWPLRSITHHLVIVHTYWWWCYGALWHDHSTVKASKRNIHKWFWYMTLLCCASPTLGHKLEILQRQIQLWVCVVAALMWQNTYTRSWYFLIGLMCFGFEKCWNCTKNKCLFFIIFYCHLGSFNRYKWYGKSEVNKQCNQKKQQKTFSTQKLQA